MKFEIPAERSKIFDDFVRSYFPLYMETVMNPKDVRPTRVPETYFALLTESDKLISLHTSEVPAVVLLVELVKNPGSRLVLVSNLDDLFHEMYR